MKKSWHPLLKKNQETVWQAENRAREERKRIEQKRKEIAEERQVQELQRLQESQGGAKRQERLDWMYSAPSGGGQGPSEAMEQFLLGKRKVDELILGDENEKLKKGASLETAFMATQTNANSVSDTRDKILNDPLLAIKKQEQKQFEELMKNPLKLREMKMKLEKMNGKKEDKERHRHRHHDRHLEKRHRDRSGERKHRDDDRESRRHRDDHRPEKRHRRDDDYDKPRRHDDRYDDRRRSEVKRDDDRRSDYRRSDYSRPRSPRVKRESRSPRSSESDEAAKAAALAAMMTNAEELESSRATRLSALEEKEKADLEREEYERTRKKELGGRAGFMREIQGRIMEEGRRAMVR